MFKLTLKGNAMSYWRNLLVFFASIGFTSAMYSYSRVMSQTTKVLLSFIMKSCLAPTDSFIYITTAPRHMSSHLEDLIGWLYIIRICFTSKLRWYSWIVECNHSKKCNKRISIRKWNYLKSLIAKCNLIVSIT